MGWSDVLSTSEVYSARTNVFPVRSCTAVNLSVNAAEAAKYALRGLLTMLRLHIKLLDERRILPSNFVNLQFVLDTISHFGD